MNLNVTKRKINTSMRPHTTLRSLLVSPKDKNEPREGVYAIPCQNCDSQYIGETKRALKTRVKEHRDDVVKMDTGRAFTRGAAQESQETVNKSAITDHVMQLNHVIDWESAKMIERESDKMVRGIKEAIAIRKTPANMNRDEGRYMLSHLYDDLLCPARRE